MEIATKPMKISTDEKRQRGFTLIEILLVMAILGMLAAMVLPNIVGSAEKARIKTAQTQIASLGTALDAFALDVGRYPDSQEGLEALVQAPQGMRMWAGPYLNKSLPMDPWGNPYEYTGPDRGNTGYELISYGADGRSGGEGGDGDISNLR